MCVVYGITNIDSNNASKIILVLYSQVSIAYFQFNMKREIALPLHKFQHSTSLSRIAQVEQKVGTK